MVLSLWAKETVPACGVFAPYVCKAGAHCLEGKTCREEAFAASLGTSARPPFDVPRPRVFAGGLGRLGGRDAAQPEAGFGDLRHVLILSPFNAVIG
jgi:hypothetical protein